MAPWVMHLRVAALVNEVLKASEAPFYVGSVAPDSGRKLDGFTYDPPKNISHCYDGIRDRLVCNDEFYYRYAANERDPAKKAFYLGYYVHVLTDTAFVSEVVHPLIVERGRDYWRANVENIRASWFEIDFRFLAENRPFHPLSVLAKLNSIPDGYLPFFRPGDVYDRVAAINALYAGCVPDEKRELIGLDCAGGDAFVIRTSERIVKRLSEMEEKDS